MNGMRGNTGKAFLGAVLLSLIVPATAEVRAATATEGEKTGDTTAPALPPRRPVVQIALLLDTSSSMEGLIHQAKTRLWDIVNEFVLARRNGERPIFEVALYEYGNKTLGAGSNFLREVAPLTDDLDKISEELFRLKIMSYGSQEYCGAVIRQAARMLDWSLAREDLKVIFIAGNESFAQGPVDYKEACREAITKGVIVNTIFCGSHADGVSLGWEDGARRAEGTCSSIDQNRRVSRVATPQDEELARLGKALNDSYVPYGPRGATGKARQEAQDKNAEASDGSVVQRAVTKSSALYSNATWDLVDAVRARKVKLEEIHDDALPAEMRPMSLAERKSYLERKAKERAEIQARILALNKKRVEYLEKRKAAPTAAGERRATLDDAVIKTLREQARKKKFELE